MIGTLLLMLLLTEACGHGEKQGTPLAVATTTEVERRMDSLLQCQLELPQGMTHSRAGKHFLWVSDNEAPTMRNICIYSYPGFALEAGRVTMVRDSVMRENIKGESDGMFMHTEAKVPVTHKMMTWKGHRLLRTAGMWEMEGDAMGGPFVCHSRVDSLRNRVVVAEAFVFAPGRNKEETMKRLEAQLLKLRINE